MRLVWAPDGMSSTFGGVYRITLHDNQYELQWLPPNGHYWQRLAVEDDLMQAKMSASIHASLSDEDKGIVFTRA